MRPDAEATDSELGLGDIIVRYRSHPAGLCICAAVYFVFREA